MGWEVGVGMGVRHVCPPPGGGGGVAGVQVSNILQEFIKELSIHTIILTVKVFTLNCDSNL